MLELPAMALLTPVTATFLPHGQLLSDEAIERGHINRTYMTVVEEDGVPRRYIHQHINTRVFPDPVMVMANIRQVLDHLAKKRPNDLGRLELIRSDAGLDYHLDEHGQYWRCYRYVEGSTSFDVVPNADIAYRAALAFGSFLADLSDLDPQQLSITIPDFHNTIFRLQQLDSAHKSAEPERLLAAAADLVFVEEHRKLAAMLVDLMQENPEAVRVTHNDTKVNNVLFCDKTLNGLSVIDLDTVMPGTALFDIGDLIRTACTTAEEDEPDLAKVHFDADRFEAIIRGYAETVGPSLHPAEWQAMPYCGAIITLTIGIRFLTDYLNGDVYFRTYRDHHNLDRARTQFELVRQQLDRIDELQAIVDRHAPSA